MEVNINSGYLSLPAGETGRTEESIRPVQLNICIFLGFKRNSYSEIRRQRRKMPLVSIGSIDFQCRSIVLRMVGSTQSVTQPPDHIRLS